MGGRTVLAEVQVVHDKFSAANPGFPGGVNLKLRGRQR